MTIDDMIAVLQAAKEGKTVQFKSKATGYWYDCDAGSVNFDTDYRVRPEPREWWIQLEKRTDGSEYSFGMAYSDTKKGIHVREVIE